MGDIYDHGNRIREDKTKRCPKCGCTTFLYRCPLTGRCAKCGHVMPRRSKAGKPLTRGQKKLF